MTKGKRNDLQPITREEFEEAKHTELRGGRLSWIEILLELEPGSTWKIEYTQVNSATRMVYRLRKDIKNNLVTGLDVIHHGTTIYISRDPVEEDG